MGIFQDQFGNVINGPWDSDEDNADWTLYGYKCAARRNPLGALCGYVGIPTTHILHGVDYHQKSEKLKDLLEKTLNNPMPANPGMGILLAALSGNIEATPEIVFDVHGGITFSGNAIMNNPTGDNYWYFGFDCSHSGDMTPGLVSISNKLGFAQHHSHEVYRDMQYVKSEVEKLARQLKDLEEAHNYVQTN